MSRSPLVPTALVLTAVTLPATAAHAQSPPANGTVTATGAGTTTPTPLSRTSNASIAKAVRDAQAAALPLAITAARARAQSLASASGLGLGALVSISDQAGSPFFYSGPFGAEGTFGPGRYCGTVPRYRITRLASGRVRRTRIGTRRTCRIPSRISTTVTITYATASPAPAS